MNPSVYLLLLLSLSLTCSSPVNKENKKDDQPLSRAPIIAICTLTKSSQSWTSLSDTSLHAILLPSIISSIYPIEAHKYSIHLYIAADKGDPFWEKHYTHLQQSPIIPSWLSVSFSFFQKEYINNNHHKLPLNSLMQLAFDNDSEYLIRINDDTEFITSGWISHGIAALQSFNPPNIGVVGPTCNEGNVRILTHDMVHRSHLLIFPTYYPASFSHWWVDVWITHVYQPHHAIKLESWVVKHHTHLHGRRYATVAYEKRFLHREIEKGKDTIATYIAHPEDPETIYNVLLQQQARGGTRTVIIAFAINYGYGTFVNFIHSLRNVYSGDVVLFVSNLSLALTTLCNTHNIITRTPPPTTLSIVIQRFVSYASVCKDYTVCFATDFRDVFFQADPFQTIPPYDLIFSEEFSKVKIETCPYNSKWIKGCYGASVIARIGDNPPICAGTIMGTPHGFHILTAALLREIESTYKITGCVGKTIDQGYVNYLYYTKQLNCSVVAQPRGQGIVNTVGYITPRSSITNYIRYDGYVKNTDNSISPVVHQYDRFPELVSLVARLPAVPPTSTTQDPLFITNKRYINDICTLSYKTRSSNTLTLPIPQNSIICTQGTAPILREFFNLLITAPFTLVTIESDDPIPHNTSWLSHPFLTKWYSWNANHENITAIPIGLNHDTQLRPMSMASITPSKQKIQKLLVNFKHDTLERINLYTSLLNSHTSFSANTWVHFEPYVKKWDSSSSLTSHYTLMSNYKWILCPSGAGQDTHRVWETLYLGSIPVVLKSNISSLYNSLPVIQLDSWNQLSWDTLSSYPFPSPSTTSAYFHHWASIITQQQP